MDPSILIILIFIAAPLIERLLKAGKQQQPPQQRRPMPPPRQRLPEQRPATQAEEPPARVVIARREEEESAAAMLPDDLWEILTGERRPQSVPAPRPEWEVEEEEEEAYALEQPVSSEEEYTRLRREPAPVVLPEEPYVRPLPRHEPPAIVSLEEVDIDDRLRHRQFHERLSSIAPAARVHLSAPSRHLMPSGEELRHAIIMAEVLGKPKGLE
ncbi:MAG TPA: hypothetical protein VFZ24_18265 [Longimicrobiales bacterium]